MSHINMLRSNITASHGVAEQTGVRAGGGGGEGLRTPGDATLPL